LCIGSDELVSVVRDPKVHRCALRLGAFSQVTEPDTAQLGGGVGLRQARTVVAHAVDADDPQLRQLAQLASAG
jgi:hypothetical protein